MYVCIYIFSCLRFAVERSFNDIEKNKYISVTLTLQNVPPIKMRSRANCVANVFCFTKIQTIIWYQRQTREFRCNQVSAMCL